MYLSEIYIENFKGIKKTKIDLLANTNGIKNDILTNRFKLIDGKSAVPSLISFVGRNGVGKTSIMRALSLIKDIKSDSITKVIIDTMIQQESARSASINISNITKLANQESINAYQKEVNKISNEISESIRNRKGHYFNQFLADTSKWLKNYFETHAHNGNYENMKFKLSFIDTKNKFGYIEISISRDGIFAENIKGDFKEKDYFQYFSKVFAPSREYILSRNPVFTTGTPPLTSYLDTKQIDHIINSLLRWAGYEKTKILLKLADESVADIRYTNNNSIFSVSNIVLETGSNIQPSSLSNGTKQFLAIAEAIIRAFKIKDKNGGLFLVDEIESSLHNELVQTIYQMLYKLFEIKNVQTIITTHNISSLKPLVTNKQIYSLEKTQEEIKAIKVSSFMKEHESILTKYTNGLVAPYPDSELARNLISEVLYNV